MDCDAIHASSSLGRYHFVAVAASDVDGMVAAAFVELVTMAILVGTWCLFLHCDPRLDDHEVYDCYVADPAVKQTQTLMVVLF